jgi:gliding motility-associated-like protein
VNPLPVANITGDFIICAGETTLLTASGGTSYAWSTGETTQDISVGAAGLYTVTVTDGNTCTSTTTINLTVNPLPTAAIAGDLDICAGQSTTLTASGGLSYAWSTGDLTADINVGVAGDYTVTVTDGNGCTDEATVTLVVNLLPTAAISGDLDICSGESTILTASGGTSYLWSTGDNTAATSMGLAGTYTVTVTDGNGCSDTETTTVTVNPLPVANITGDFIICAGETTLLTASGGTSYAWSTGETTEDISVGAAGLYTVTVTDGNTCTSTTTIFLTVNPVPTAAISGDLDICIGGTTTLTASGGSSYAWSTGDLTADINVGAAGDYTVTVTDGNGCTDEATVTLVVNPLPIAAISGDLDICLGQSTILTASGGTGYAWSTGDNTAATSVGLSGTYTVTVTDGNGCSDTETATVTVNPLPVANITGDFIICAGETTLLTASGGTSYAWSTGETTQDISTGAAGFYTVTVTDGNACTNTTTSSLTVNPLPTAAISGDLDICAGQSTTLTASGGLSYEWSTGDLTADINVGVAGDYTVTVTDGNGCTDEATVALVVNPLPVAGILGILDYCIGGNTELTATGGTDYLWEDNSTDPVRLVTAGTYTVTVTDANACSNIASVTVTESPTLTVVISGNLEYCAGSSTTLTAAGGVSYLWDDNSTDPVRQVTAGSYTVTATDANGCTGENSVVVTENALPVAVISGDLEICAGGSTVLTASGGTGYAWSTAGATADISAGVAGGYTVTVTDGNGCTDAATATLVVNPLPVAAISGDLDICAGESTILTASGGTGYLWSTGDNTEATSIGLSGTYTVTVSDANTCTSTAETTVTVNPLPTANITGDFEICAGETTLLTASGGTSYAWSTGETTESISTGAAGFYTVTVTDGNTCTSTTTSSLTVNPLPTAAISGDLDICIGDATTLTASGGLSYAWSTSDLTADINVGAAGGYTVTVTDANSCTDEASVTIIVNPLPVAAISGDLDICSGESTILTASGGTGYLWSTGDNTEATSIGLSGTYTVTVSDANICTSTAETTVTVNPLPTASITGNFEICAGETTTLTASGGTSYAWSTGDLTADINVGTAGLYTVTVTDGNGCTGTTTINLTVNPLPTAAISGDLDICAGDATTLTASGGTGYTWSTAGVTADISVGVAGDYTVTVTDGNGCTDEAMITLVVNPLPVAAITGDLDICAGESTILTASGGTGYLWSTGDNTDATSIGLSGTYTVTVTDANACTSTAETTVTVNPLPTANITGDFEICAGETTLLTASGGTSYAWSTGETTESISTGAAGFYTVTVTDGNACTSTTTSSLTVNPLPTAAISGDLEICAGGSTVLTASGGTGYEWSTAEVTADISVGMAGGYTVTATDANGCTDTEAVSVSEFGYVVTTTADSGPGSFRQTLECASDIPGTNVITFNIPGSGPFEIKLTAPLPPVSDSTIIDATTQPGWSLGQIVLTPASPGLIAEGLTVTANKCQVSGLAFSGFAAAGVFATGANDFTLRDCRVDSCSVGIVVEAGARSVIENCVIANNLLGGIGAGTASFVQVFRNTLYCNGGDPFVPASNATVPPAIDSATATIISGTATFVPGSQSLVQIFTANDPACLTADIQGKDFVAQADVQPDGRWSVSGNFTPGTQLTATQTYNPDGFFAPPAVGAKGSAFIFPPPGDASTSDFSPSACVGYNTTIVQPLCAGEVFNFNGIDYGVTGTYVANLVASDGCDSVVTLNLQVFPVFIAVQQASICAGDSLIVGGTFQTEQGLYVDTLQKANGCDSIVYTFLFINDLPTVAINAPSVICPGDVATLSVAGNFNGYLWGPGGAQTSSITIDTAGMYSVTVTDINGCTAADTVDIVEYCNSVTALFEVSQDTACIAHFVQFTDKSSPNTTSWFWDFGNGNSSAEQNPFDIYPVPGTYTVTLVAFDGVGSDTFKTTLFVYDSMATNFLFAIPDSCTPNLVQFTDAITTLFPIATWQWNFGDGQFGNTSSPGHLYEVFDTANVNLTITDIYNCTTSISRNVEVIDFGRTPDPVFRNVTLCENQPYLGVLYAQDTTLVDTLVAASGCDSIIITNISVDQLPNQLAAAGPDADICLGASILTLQAVAAGIGYGTWTALTPDVSINNSNNPNTTVSNLSDGANIFVWSLSNGACLDYSRDTVVLNIIPAPGEIAEAGDDVLLCQQLPTTTLAAKPPTLPGVTGIWSQSVAQAQSGVVIANPANWNTSVSGLKPGSVYEFRWTLRTALCGDFSSDVVRINLALEQANAGPNQQTCPQESETVLLANLPAGATGQWRTAGATTAVIESPQSAETDVSGLLVGANLFIWTLSAPGCPDYTSDTVVVTAYGAFEAKEDVFFNLGQSSTLRLDVLANDVLPNSPFITVTALLPVPDGLSDNGDGSFTYLFDTTFQEKIVFSYRVCVADCPGLCDDALVTILSEPPPTPAPPIEPPKNVITPNEDGVGDALKIPNFETYANDIELIILSRWGDVVYQTKRYDNNWQGVNSNGKPLPDGTYYYIIRAGVQDNLVINGTITILR